MKLLQKILLSGAALIAIKGLDTRLEVTHYAVRSHKIPKAFDGYKIVQVSDMHCEHIAGLLNEISSENPNIIVSTGDMVNDYGEITPAIRFTQSLAQIAPLYLITGNHDVWRNDYKELIEKSKQVGGIFLNDETVILEKDGSQIALTGISDPYSRTTSQIKDRLKKLLDSLTLFDGFNILLFHRANLLDFFKDKGYDLILSGHMHGGQIRLPGLGGLFSPRTSIGTDKRLLFPHYFGGVYNEGNTKMIVSRGLGNPMIIPRIFNRPELVVITLEHNDNTAPSE